MASPKSPTSVGQLKLPPLIDPDGVREVYANDVIIQVRHDTVQLTFNSIQAADCDERGNTTDQRVVRSRVAIPGQVFNAMLKVAQDINTAVQHHQALLKLTPDVSKN